MTIPIESDFTGFILEAYRKIKRSCATTPTGEGTPWAADVPRSPSAFVGSHTIKARRTTDVAEGQTEARNSALSGRGLSGRVQAAISARVRTVIEQSKRSTLANNFRPSAFP